MINSSARWLLVRVDELDAFCYTGTVTDTHSDTYPNVYYCASVLKLVFENSAKW